MKRMLSHKVIASFILVLSTTFGLQAQQGCQLQDPVIHIDFGIGDNIPEFNATEHDNYRKVRRSCPDDGSYTYTSTTSNCFNNDWFTISSDHSGNGGNMMLVNASESGGSFFTTILNGLKENTRYEFAVWLMNVCRINGGCSPLPPNLQITVSTMSGSKIAGFITGTLGQTASPHWNRHAAFFTTPAGETTLSVTMSNLTLGGCGNDFAMDDITVRECMPPVVAIEAPADKAIEPFAKPITKQAAKVETKPVVKPVQKPEAVVTEKEEKSLPGVKPVRKDTAMAVSKQPANKVPAITQPALQSPLSPVLPPVLLQRENQVLKKLTTAAGEMQIDLYDNGQVDGDTVTIYHNNIILISRAGLSEKPISFKIMVDEKQPHHELVMVANNLGSIPPNTSLMIIRINGKRYDVFISSSEQKNAKVVIDLGE